MDLVQARRCDDDDDVVAVVVVDVVGMDWFLGASSEVVIIKARPAH